MELFIFVRHEGLDIQCQLKPRPRSLDNRYRLLWTFLTGLKPSQRPRIYRHDLLV